ncbi:MAG: AIR synthase related protein, partial [Planctomycetota bacterium]
MDELSLVEWLRGRLPQGEGVLLGPGDDCALLDPTGTGPLAATVDTLLEGSHFSESDSGYDVGWKAVAVNLSDLAAMGCRPLWALTGFGVRRGV